jgi:hypothetical protein
MLLHVCLPNHDTSFLPFHDIHYHSYYSLTRLNPRNPLAYLTIELAIVFVNPIPQFYNSANQFLRLYSNAGFVPFVCPSCVCCFFSSPTIVIM